MSYGPRVERKRQKPRLVWPGVLLFFLLLLCGALLAVPSFMYVDKPPAARPDLVFSGVRQKYPVVLQDGDAYVPFTFVKDMLDPDVFWDDSGTVIVTTKDKVVKLATDSLTAYVNRHAVDLQVPVILEGGEPYIPEATLRLLYPVETLGSDDEAVFVVRRTDQPSIVARPVRRVVIRTSPSVLARRVGVASAGTEVYLYDSVGNFTRVETEEGLVGWARRAELGESFERVPTEVPGKEYVPSPISGDKIALVWEQVERYTVDPRGLGPMPGLNVVSPTWFRLGSEPGEVLNYADYRYVSWAHGRGYRVWALFSNSFDLGLTRTVLRDLDLRDKVISQILLYADMYSLDGINLDFENVYQEDGPYLTQFVRELTPLLHEMGLTVSIDVTVKSLSPTWSLCYERARLAETVDYMMLMAYDQYPAGSRTAGPTAAIPWTKWTVETTLKEAPAEKLVLGVPFYTRLWTEVSGASGSSVSQRALGMASATNWYTGEGITPVYDSDTELWYVDKTFADKTCKMWLENQESMGKRMEIAREFGLAGIAAWSRGFEVPEIWDKIGAYACPGVGGQAD